MVLFKSTVEKKYGETALVRTLNLENPELFPVSANSR
jgi:hypothetical protein